MDAEMDEVSEAYWAGAAKGELVLQRCSDCGHIRHYPQLLCPLCHSFATEHVRATGKGTIYSWTVCHHPYAPEVVDEVPYTLVTVDMEEGVRVLGRLHADTAPRIGLPVTLQFDAAGDDRPGPVFAPFS
jgi:hypothetical protein